MNISGISAAFPQPQPYGKDSVQARDASGKVLPFSLPSGGVVSVMMEINYRSLRAVSSAHGMEFEFKSLDMKFEMSAVSEEAVETAKPALLDKLKEYFSPENTSERIVGFALSRYSGSSEADRNAYFEYIMPAIEKGFESALDILGPLSDEVMGIIDKTKELIDNMMSNFVKTGERPGFDSGLVDIKA